MEESPLATLYLNLHSPLVRRLMELSDEPLLESMARVLYIQALLAGGHPLRGGELKTLNQELLHLLRRAGEALDPIAFLPQIPMAQWQALLQQFYDLVKRYRLGLRTYRWQLCRMWQYIDRETACERRNRARTPFSVKGTGTAVT